jgi:chemotaxis protein methyltransferase CheR
VTRFFREGHHFDQLRNAILPGLVAKAKSGGRVRIWSAGCSSGEEPFSIAMEVVAAFPGVDAANVRILATDIDRNVLDMGRAARYRIGAEDRAASPLISKSMVPVPEQKDLFEVAPKVRALVQFAELNLQQPWPMQGKFDVIFCRNVVIYFSTETQQTLWPRFADSLAPGGHLMIGHSERVTGKAVSRLRSCGVTQYQLIA